MLQTEATDQLTTGAGAPVGNKTAVLTVGPRGPMLMQDFVFMDEMAHFDHERIPERVVHAKGAGKSLSVVSLVEIFGLHLTLVYTLQCRDTKTRRIKVKITEINMDLQSL